MDNVRTIFALGPVHEIFTSDQVLKTSRGQWTSRYQSDITSPHDLNVFLELEHQDYIIGKT